MPPDEKRDYLRRMNEQALSLFRETHVFSRFSHEHSDKMLTWAIGLMGVGLASGYSLLAHVPWGWRCLVLAPWLLGILSALAGRVVGSACRNKNDLYYSAMVAAMGLVSLEEDPAAISQQFSAVLKGTDPSIVGPEKAVKGLVWWSNFFYYSAHGFFAVGVVTVAGALMVAGPAQP